MRIVVIDDDTAMTDLLEILLETESIEVVTTNSGKHGISKTRQTDPDLIILDLMMPDVDGWQICKQIRDFSTVPILILSALDSPGLIAEALDEGADDYLIKPVTKSMLLARVNRLSTRSRKNGNNTSLLSFPN
jgi:two-component system response regulator MprA